MSRWQQNFTQRLSELRSVSALQFDQSVAGVIDPAFGEMAEFVVTGGMTAAESDHCPEVRSYRFCMDDLCVNVSFAMTNPLRIESMYRLEGEIEQPTSQRIDSTGAGELDTAWAIRQFQMALEALLDHIESVGVKPEAVDAAA